MTRTRLARYAATLLLLGSTAFAINIAKNLKAETDPDDAGATTATCETYHHWDLGIFNLETITLQPNDMLGPLLSNRGVEYFKIDELIRKAASIFPLRSMRAGKELTLVTDPASDKVHAVVYEPDPYREVVYHIGDSIHVEMIQKETELRLESASGTINGSLWASMEDQHLPIDLIAAMEGALGWSVDFYHIQKGDSYKLVYERKYVEGEPIGIGRLIGAEFTSGKTSYHAIAYKSSKHDGYYDLEGRPMKKAFLKSPVEYARISSRFSNNRFHPILKRNKGHFGTDYAAACGTPIRAVANGRVTHAAYTSGNGKYVKITHDKTYATQYLHMSRFADGIRPGTMVKQGQTIGYVGQTGLATGCHVCFRFWKNGRQVDHLREKMPPPEAMPAAELPDYMKVRDQVKALLDSIQPGQPVELCVDPDAAMPVQS